MSFNKYHFHIYFSDSEIEKATELIEKVSFLQFAQIGRIREHPVGPHPVGSCQITVSGNHFKEASEWFMKNRNGLSIFVHPVSGDDLKDHTDFVMWLGESYALKKEFFKKC